MIKMRAPDGVTAFSHQGYPVEIGEDGAVHVDARHAGDLAAHGFTAWDQAPPPAAELAPPIPDARRVRLVTLFAERVAVMSDEEVAAMEASAEEQIQQEREAAEQVDPDAVTEAGIDEMKRAELFAFLKARGIPAVPPIDNDTLRVKARAALAA